MPSDRAEGEVSNIRLVAIGAEPTAHADKSGGPEPAPPTGGDKSGKGRGGPTGMPEESSGGRNRPGEGRATGGGGGSGGRPSGGRQSTGRNLASAALLIAVLTIASRILGFVRTLVLGAVADSGLSTAYLTANLVPNIIFEIIVGGALAALVVPLIAGPIARGDRAEVGRTASALVGWVLVILVPIAILVAIFARPVVTVLLGAVTTDRPDVIAVGTRMLRIFAPQLPLYGIGIVLTGLLQAHRRFAWPVLAPLLSSVVVIATYVTYGLAEPSAANITEVSTGGQLILAIGTTLGVAVLSLCLVIPVSTLRLSWRPTLHFDPGARRSVRGLAAVGIVTVAAQQLTLALATRLVNGSGLIVVLTLAQTVFFVPWSVLAVPVAISVYPALATAHATDDPPTYRRTLAGATRSVLLLTALGAAAMAAAAQPIGRIFAAIATSAKPDPDALAAGLIAFAPGLIGYGLYALHSRALYARHDNRYAAAATLAGWGTVAIASLVLSAVLPVPSRVTALAAANSIGMTVLAAVLIAILARRAGRAALAGVPRATVTALVAGCVAAVAGSVAREPFGGAPGVGGDVLRGIVSGIVALAVFGALAVALDRHDVRPIVARAGAALRGRRAGGAQAPSPNGTNGDNMGGSDDRDR